MSGSQSWSELPHFLMLFPGQKLVSDCTAVTDTECVPCSEGEFMGTWSSERHCHPHRYCDPSVWAVGDRCLGVGLIFQLILFFKLIYVY